MRIAFRVDASLEIGSGHVMRCLTLADTLRAEGADCHFVSREHPGHLLHAIRARGYKVHPLPYGSSGGVARMPLYEQWLGCDWQIDALQVEAILSELDVDWLVVDHYSLDSRWEQALTPHCRHLMVIDDLATRSHSCTLLLDQNLGRELSDYVGLIPVACTSLVGPQFALLQPEFSELRSDSVARRAEGGLHQVLISLGGVDKDNATCAVLEALSTCRLPSSCCLVVVMGGQAPWLSEVRMRAKTMPWRTEVLVNISDMAKRMADSDLAIGAAGGTAWERCCLGLPALIVVLADNQWPGARALAASHGAWLVGEQTDISLQLPKLVSDLMQVPAMTTMSEYASKVTDGKGASRVVAMMRKRNVSR